MPIYEYQCETCQHQLEVLQKISESPLQQCPACGESALKKLISASAFRLKGGGWYETDFKTGDKKNLAGERDDKSGASQGAGSSTSDNSTTDNSAAGDGKAVKATGGDKGKAVSTDKTSTDKSSSTGKAAPNGS
jgi:putative FmdB family regulatory protein